ncbi:MAG: hypothetical protein HY052_05890 [Proteobacteria bacterium]|nr:hypothetical protein [Pseudomonadota bacterium]
MVSFTTANFGRLSFSSAPSGAASLKVDPTSPTAAADKGLYALLQDPKLQQSLVAHTMPNVPLNPVWVLATLWGLFDTNSGTTINKSDVQQALAEDGIRDAKDVNALWAQISPDNRFSVSAKEVTLNQYLGPSIQLKLKAVSAAIEETRWKNPPSLVTGTLLDYYQPNGGSSGSVLDTSA